MTPDAEHAPLLVATRLVAEMPGDDGPARVLGGVSLQLHAGEIVDVTGPSGCGKTTLLRALARLLPNATGELRLEGRDASGIAPQRWRAEVALVPQRPALVPGTVRANLRLPSTLKVRAGDPRVADEALSLALASVGLGDVGLDRDVSRLSVGQQARVAMLRTMLTSPKVLLLDEPDAALDDDTAQQVAMMTRAFAEHGGGVVRVRHARVDALASRRLRLAGGVLGTEARDDC